ncbi:MAG TPA: ATP-binding protein [Gammaproteobacteria bacterium]|nr:ATP-binding protein [Gammaproteobacteria bacterium]
MISAEKALEPDPPRAPANSAETGAADAAKGGRCGSLFHVAFRFGTSLAEKRPWPGRQPSIWDRTDVRCGLAVLLVFAAVGVTMITTSSTGRLLSFPFYAAVVGGAWFGLGPGVLAFALSALAAADFWTPEWFNLDIRPADLPSFIAFVLFALMSLAWGFQRRRTQYALEATVQQRTADLVKANAALQAEMAQREAAQKERARTERALREAEVELARTLRLATMAELAATIAHEINQPLAAITANGSACLRSLGRNPPMLDTAREAAACIVADGHRAGDVIARIRALFNKEPPCEQLLDLNDVIRRVLELSRGAIERQQVALRTELAQPAAMVMADPVQLQQVLVNLVNNALEAMEGGGLRPRVLDVRSEIERGEAVAVTVEDTGSGLDPEQVSHVFDSFYTTKAGGIGLGLAISRSIVEAHGGTMWAEPAADGGARLGLRLMLAFGSGH